MRVSMLCLGLVCLTAVWLAMPSSHTVFDDDWICTDLRSRRFGPVPAIRWDRCFQWTRKGER